MTATPAPAAVPAGPAADIRRVLQACRHSGVALAVFSGAVNLLFLVPSLYMLQVYDRVLGSGSLATLAMLSLVVLFLLAAMGILEWVRSQILVQLSQRADGMLSDRLFDLSYRQALSTGGAQTAAQPLQDLQGIRQFVTGPGVIAFFDAPWMPLYLIVLFAMHPAFGCMGLGAAALLIAVSVLNERGTAGLLADANRESIAAQSALGRALRNAEVVEALGMLPRLRQRWQKRSSAVLDAQLLASRRGGRWGSVSRWLRLVMQSAVLGVGAWLSLRQAISPGMMIAASITLGRALAPVDQLTGVWRQFVLARQQYRRLNDWLHRVQVAPPRMPLPAPSGRLAVESVMVVPPGAQQPALRQISFSLQPGEVLGIVGPSAAGKSSLARTLLGVWPTVQGKVRLDGADVYGWTREELGPHLGYLPQDIELFDGSIAENIARFGDVDGDQVVAAARLAGVHEMVLRMPQGYDTAVAAIGGLLTGGQRQRIGLARAVYGNPKLVVLDEPNSNLDTAGSDALVSALQALKAAGTTVVVISHRSSLLPVLDKLLVLDEGQQRYFGPRDEVRRAMREAELQKTSTNRVVALAASTGAMS